MRLPLSPLAPPQPCASVISELRTRKNPAVHLNLYFTPSTLPQSNLYCTLSSLHPHFPRVSSMDRADDLTGQHGAPRAARISYDSSTLPAMVAYVVDDNVDGLTTTTRFTSADIHKVIFPAPTDEEIAIARAEPTYFNLEGEALKTANDDLLAKLKVLGITEPMPPDDEPLLKEITLLLLAHPNLVDDVTGTTSNNKLKFVKRHLKYAKAWQVSENRLKTMLLQLHQVTSFGLIPVTDEHIAAAAEYEAQLKHIATLPQRKQKADKNTTNDEADKDAAKDLAKTLRRTRNIVPQKTIHDLLDEGNTFRQNEDTLIYVTFTKDTLYKSLIRFTHRFHYLDPSTPKKQPSHRADVELTHRNARPKGDYEVQYEPESYARSHHALNVSDSKYMPALQKLFQHATRNQKKEYFAGLYESARASGHQLFLIAFYHNEAPCTSNVLTRRANMPADYDDLRILMKHNPKMFMLVCGTGLPATVDKTINEFDNLCKRDPTNDFFEEPSNPSLNHKGVRENSQLPKFQRAARYTFETWNELERTSGIGALLEGRFGSGKYTHEGQACIVPVPTTFHEKSSLHLAYNVQFAPEYEEGVPALTEGDFVQVELSVDSSKADSCHAEHPWKGRVTEPCDATGLNQINLSLKRPIDKAANEIQDSKEYSSLTTEDLGKMSSSSLQTWSRENCNVAIRVTYKGDTNDNKRKMYGIAQMKVPRKLRDELKIKAEKLDSLRQFLQCTDHTVAKGTHLYIDVNPTFLHRALPLLQNYLHAYQWGPLEEGQAGALYDNNMIIIGPSGSGKTTLGIAGAMPYLGLVKYQEDVCKIADHEQEIFLAGEDALHDAQQRNLKDAEPLALDGALWEEGRITACAIQNETVDDMYLKVRSMVDDFSSNTGLAPKMVLRLHSMKAEISAVVAMARPNYDPTTRKAPGILNPAVKADGVAQNLLEHYLIQFHGSTHPGIKDRRIKQLEGSAAKYILELARFEGFTYSPKVFSTYSPEVLATFTPEELTHFATLLKPIAQMRSDLLANNNRMDAHALEKVEQVVKQVMRKLLQKVAVICTTVSIATRADFAVFRQTHCLVVDELGRANDADAMGFFSLYWSASVRFLIGDPNQLKPMAFGPARENPFQKQIQLSLLTRLVATGAHHFFLPYTARFENPELLQICALVNDIPNLEPVPGAYNTENTEKYAAVMESIWGINHPIAIVNTTQCVVGGDKIKYCVQTAQVAMKTLVEACGQLDGSRIAVITPYNAQKLLLQRMRASAIVRATAQGDAELAQRLKKADIMTIDSSMGKERSFIIVDTAAHPGHILEQERTLVTLTRAKVAMVLILPIWEFTGVKSKRSLVQIICQLHTAKKFVSVDQKARKRYEQYKEVAEAMGF
jgi:hypothetical protein